MGYGGRDEERERERILLVQKDPSEGSFSSMPSLQRLIFGTGRLPVPTVEHLSAGLYCRSRFPLKAGATVTVSDGPGELPA